MCYKCGNTINGKIRKHKLKCPARNSKCYKRQRMGHFTKFYKITAETKKVDEDRQTPSDSMKDIEDKIYNVNLFRISINITGNDLQGKSVNQNSVMSGRLPS